MKLYQPYAYFQTKFQTPWYINQKRPGLTLKESSCSQIKLDKRRDCLSEASYV